MGIDIIVLLVVVLPGFAALFIRNQIALPVPKKKQSELKEVLRGLLNGIPIITALLMWITFKDGIQTVERLKAALEEMPRIISWLLITLAITILYGLAWGGLACVYARVKLWWIDWKTEHGHYAQNERTCWETFMTSEGRARYVNVIIGDKKNSGFIKDTAFGDEEDGELILMIPEQIEQYSALNDSLKKARINEIYVNANKHIVIESYDLTDFNAVSEKLKEEYKTANG
jgi:hypothetical protein